MIPLALYIHIPWCLKKCPYCDFFSTSGPFPETDYIRALIRDFIEDLPLSSGRPFSSLFIGGGTPSLLSPHSINSLFDALDERALFEPQAEKTIEANPGTVSPDSLRHWKERGINRISLGIQSFEDKKLAAIGRIHDGSTAKYALEAAQREWENVNIDLIYGLPDQTVAQAIRDLEIACSFHPSHLSWYSLTIEPGTAFGRVPPSLPSEDVCLEMEREGRAFLQDRGYERYEISNYALPSSRCQHNLNYWQYGDYLGIGGGAKGKLTLPSGKRVRTSKTKDLIAYGRGQSIVTQTPVIPSTLPIEFMINALRLVEGFRSVLWTERTGKPIEAIEPLWQKAAQEGFLIYEPNHIRPTAWGLLFLNECLKLFL